jgi:putative tryptophan/tyrosine transport system substrate-binding protein
MLGRSDWLMRRRLCSWLRCGLFLAGLLFSGHTLADVVWVALSSKEPAYLEAANALRAALPDDQVRVGEWSEFNFKATLPQVLVTVGSEALRQLHQAAEKTRIVTLLVPRSTLDELRDASAGRITGVYYEQPIARQASLLRAAFPEMSRVAIVLGPTSARYRGELAQALHHVGMEGVFELVADKTELSEAVQNVLSNSDVFLALPDAEAINNRTAKFVLLATYRRGIPVVGYSASFVKAGAAVALVSSPTQIGREAAQMVNETLHGKRLPAPRAPAEFEVLVNASVARSLSLGLDAALMEKRVRGEGNSR